MGAYVDLQDPHEEPLTGGPRSGDVAVADFLWDVWRLKRLTQLGVYSGIAASLPLFYFLVAFSPQQLLAVLVAGLVIATAAIEGAFAQVFRLRKRSAYPGAVSLHLGALPAFDVACQAAVTITDKLLGLRGSFLGLQKEGGFLSLVALSSLSRAEADRYLRLGAACVQHALSTRQVAALRSDDGLLAGTMAPPGQQVVFVPVQSFQRPMGILGLLAENSNPDLRDGELLISLGHAIGVSLESVLQRDELRTMAAIDELTRVYNRRYFFDQLGREIAAARRYAMAVSVLIFDLDGLKELNDGFGHEVGDEALRTLAQRLVRYSRASDIVARLGGDEFAVILPRTDCAGAAQISRRLQSAVEGEVLAVGEGQGLRVAVSCGFACFPDDGEDAGQLLRQADGRMYAAKAARSGAARKRRE